MKRRSDVADVIESLGRGMVGKQVAIGTADGVVHRGEVLGWEVSLTFGVRIKTVDGEAYINFKHMAWVKVAEL